jgi:hypothetical protein
MSGDFPEGIPSLLSSKICLAKVLLELRSLFLKAIRVALRDITLLAQAHVLAVKPVSLGVESNKLVLPLLEMDRPRT